MSYVNAENLKRELELQRSRYGDDGVYDRYYASVLNAILNETALMKAIFSDDDSPPIEDRQDLFNSGFSSGADLPMLKILGREDLSLNFEELDPLRFIPCSVVCVDERTGDIDRKTTTLHEYQKHLFLGRAGVYAGVPLVNPLVEQIKRYVVSEEEYVNAEWVYERLEDIGDTILEKIILDEPPEPSPKKGHRVRLVPDTYGVSGVVSRVSGPLLRLYHVPAEVLYSVDNGNETYIVAGYDNTSRASAIYLLNLKGWKGKVAVVPWTKLMAGVRGEMILPLDSKTLLIVERQRDGRWRKTQKLRISVSEGGEQGTANDFVVKDASPEHILEIIESINGEETED